MSDELLAIFRAEFQAALGPIAAGLESLNSRVDKLIAEFGTVVVESIPAGDEP